MYLNKANTITQKNVSSLFNIYTDFFPYKQH